MDNVLISKLSIKDYDKILSLWKTDKNIKLTKADSRENLKQFLKRNRDSNFVAKTDGKIIGTILAGEDGRRAFLYHLFVEENYRNLGIGKKLVEKALEVLKKKNIEKCNIFVLGNNKDAQIFWEKIGFVKRESSDIVVFSKDLC